MDEHVDYFEEDELAGFYSDDGTRLSEDLIIKPALCLSCIHENDPSQETMCTLTRLDQEEEDDFICGAYQRVSSGG